MSVAVATIDDVGALSDVPALSVTDGGAVSHTVSADKKGVVFINTGEEICWFGGSTVDADAGRGILLLPRVYFIWRNASSDFKVYFQCTTGLSTTVSLCEYA